MATHVYLLDNGTLMRDMSFVTWNHGHGIDSGFRSSRSISIIRTPRS